MNEFMKHVCNGLWAAVHLNSARSAIWYPPPKKKKFTGVRICLQYTNLNVICNHNSYFNTIVLQYIFLYECFERIQEEKQWRHKIMNDRASSGSSGGGGNATDK